MICRATVVFYVVAMVAGFIFADLVYGGETRAIVDVTNGDLASEGEKGLPALDENSTLSDYLTYAALNNPGLKAAFNRWKAAIERISQAKAYPDPRFNYAYFMREVETRVGPQRQKVGIAQTFPWFGKLNLRGDLAAEAANVEKARYDAMKLKLFYQVKEAYYEYYYLGRAISIIEEHFELMRSLERVTRAMFSSGKANNSDLIKAQVELGKLEDRLLSLRDLESPVKARLNALLGRDHEATLSRPRSVECRKVKFEEEELIAWLKHNNPDLVAIRSMARVETVKKELARKGYYPDLTLGLQYIDTSKSKMPNVSDSGKDPVMVMASINIPIWRRKYRATENEADRRYRAAVGQRIDKQNMLIAQLQLVLFKLRDAERKIGLYRDSLVPKARQALNVAQRAFAAGKARFLDLIDAERTLLDFELESQRAITDWEERLAEVEMLIGRKIPGPGEGESD